MPALTPAHCTARRHRLIELLIRERLDAAIITDARDVYYFTGVLIAADLPVALVIDINNDVLLVGPTEHDVGAVRHFVPYEWNFRGTRHPDLILRMALGFSQAWRPAQAQRLGVQRMSLLEPLAEVLRRCTRGEFSALDDALAVLQARKDSDEIELIRVSVRANLGAYKAVADTIRPGILELDVLSAGRRGATVTAGEKVFHDGDYQCGAYNGPARERSIERGELYIVDAWTCYRGYWSDMSRTFIAGTAPTDTQQRLFDHIRRVQLEAAKLLKPGVDGREIYRAMDEMIREHPALAQDGLVHHGGHCIGLRAHEMPDVNAERGGVLETGNIVCLEPGGYFAEARYGVRLENMYLITDQGCEDLCPGNVQLLQCG